MEHYTSWAKFYDRAFSRQGRAIDFVLELINEFCPNGSSVLELACGTGTNLTALATLGYKVSGLDVSPEMLEIARSKNPEGRFYQANMKAFELGATFDVILCLFDSVNHLASFAEWEGMIQSAFRHTRPGGIFVFDTNTASRLERLASGSLMAKEFDENVLTMRVVKTNRETFVWKIKIYEYVGNSSYVLHADNIVEKTPPAKMILSALQQTYDIATMHAPSDEESERPYFLGQRLRTH